MGSIDDLDRLVGSQGSQQPARLNSTQQVGVRDAAAAPRSVAERPISDDNDYATWSLSDLQKEARKYGFREVHDRGVLIRQLRQVQEALKEKGRRTQDAEEDISIVSSSSSFLRRSSIGDLSSDVEEVSMGDLTMEILQDRNELARNRGIAPRQRVGEGEEEEAGGGQNCEEGSDDEGEEDDSSDDSDVALAKLTSDQSTTSPSELAPSLSDQLYRAVTADKSLYQRILLFEPVSFDEVSSTAKRAGVTGLRSKETLRNWLDMQGICFYSADLTGQRQRY